MFTRLPNQYKYRVTKHAIQRLKQRFFYQFPVSCFYADELTANLLKHLAATGVRYTWWEDSPFYVNKIRAKYGPLIVLNHLDKVYLICQPDGADDRLCIVTVTKDFDPRKVRMDY